MSKSNKNAATEDAMGTLHNAVTRAFTKKIDHMLLKAEEEPDDLAFIIDEKTLNAAANFLKNNDITCALPEADATNPLTRSLAAIRAKQGAKVLPFTEPERVAAC